MTAEELAAIRDRHAAYVAAFNDTAAAREAWCDEVAGTAIDCTGDVPTLLAEVDRLRAVLNARHQPPSDKALTKIHDRAHASRNSRPWRIVDWLVHQLDTARLERDAARARVIEYYPESDTTAGVQELFAALRADRPDAVIDWRYANTLALEIDDLSAKLTSLREHTLDSNPALRALHEQAVLYRDAVEAYCEVHGPLSTTLEWVIRNGSLSGNAALARLAAQKAARIADRREAKVKLDEALARIAAVEAAYRDAVDEWDAIAGRDTGVSTMAELVGVRLMPVIDPANWAASPTPTGPEPAKRPCCARPGWCACDPLTPGDEHCRWFPATPEPTEETPNPCDSPLVTRECQEACGPCWDVGGCAMHDEARRADR